MSALRLVLAVTACVLAPAASTARDLPRGTFLLAGDVFPAVQDGTISPVFAHVRTGGDRLDWTFFTVFQPNEDICRDLGRCRSFVPALGHRVAWDDDGTLRVLETRRDLGADMTVTYPANDGPHVLAAISGLLDGGRLALTAEGGRIEQRGRRSAGRTVDLLPATLDQAESALAYALMFNRSIAELDYCVMRRVLGYMADPAPTPAMTRALAAARYAAELRRLQGIAGYWTETPEDPAAAAERAAAVRRLNVFSRAVAVPVQPIAEAEAAGTPVPDAALAAAIEAALAPERDAGDARRRALAEEVAGQWQDAAVAYLRTAARAVAVPMRGADLRQAVCADAALGD